MLCWQHGLEASLSPCRRSPIWAHDGVPEPKTGHNPAPRGATVGLIHLTFTSIQMRPTAYALGDAVIKSDFLKYSMTCIVAGAAKQDETGWKGERAILSLHWPCLNARCEMRSSGLTPSFLPRPGIIIIKKRGKNAAKSSPRDNNVPLSCLFVIQMYHRDIKKQC